VEQLLLAQVTNVNKDQLMMARDEPAEHNDQCDTHDDKQIVARVGVTPAGGMGPTAQVYAIDYTRVAAVAEQ